MPQSKTYSLDVNCILHETDDAGVSSSRELPGNLTVNHTSATKFEVVGTREGEVVTSYPKLADSAVVAHFIKAGNDILVDNTPDTSDLEAWLDMDVESEAAAETLTFHVVDQANNPMGSVVVGMTDTPSIVTLCAYNPQGSELGAGEMKLYADSLGRQMPATLGLVGLTNANEAAALVEEAARWVTAATGGYVTEYELEAGARQVHVITYDDGAITSIPLYIDDEGVPRIDHTNIVEASNVGYETGTDVDGEGYRRVIIARAGGLTHFVKFRAKA